jgi:hypothetical protein
MLLLNVADGPEQQVLDGQFPPSFLGNLSLERRHLLIGDVLIGEIRVVVDHTYPRWVRPRQPMHAECRPNRA